MEALQYFNNKQTQGCHCDPNPPKTPKPCGYICTMRSRIKRVCEGHLKWVLRVANNNGFLTPHHWVNGEEIVNWKTNPWLAEETLVDAPFQIIKLGEFHRLFGYSENLNEALQRSLGNVKTALEAWIQDLDRRNRLGLYAFPRCRKEPTYSFYFTDHVLIWRAIKSVEALGWSESLRIPSGNESRPPSTSGRDRGNQTSRIYSSGKVQMNILKRFTTENPISKKRMIAVSRSPDQNRFLLRTKDIALFHAMDDGLFDKPGSNKDSSDIWQDKIDVWRNLIDCQIHHEDNDDNTWDEPLRFALSIVMAQKKKRMNLRAVDEMHAHAMSVLFQSTSCNGLIPGRLDENNEPVLYEDELVRDRFWGITFEVPYVLWKYHRDRSSKAQQPHLQHTLSEPTPSSSENTEILRYVKELLEHQRAERGLKVSRDHQMKRSFPFNNVVDQKNIVELSDEWLYKEPSFFIASNTPPGNPPPQPASEPCGAFRDVPKSKSSKMRQDTSQNNSGTKEITNWAHIMDIMRKGRTPEAAKKRLWAFFSADGIPEAIETYLRPGKQDSEENSEEYFEDEENVGTGDDVSAFFQRHRSCDAFFAEDTAAVYNTWTTEFHSFFYTIRPEESDGGATIRNMQAPKHQSFTDLGDDEAHKKLAKTVMSFRFDGDFFDRYWTCYYLEQDPKNKQDVGAVGRVNALLKEETTEQDGNVETPRARKASWQQRRVLELLIFGNIIRRMHTGAREILEKAKSNNIRATKEPGDAQPNQNGSYKVHYKDFLTTSQRCQNLQHILQTVEANLAKNMDKISQWQNREKERLAERPRWTFNDESRYRGVISKLLVSNQHQVQELRRAQTDISSFNDRLMKQLETMRNDLDQRRADDIQRFTYVTAFFLPAGFATSVFSMSGTPDRSTVVPMAITAIILLLLTVFLLLFAESFGTLRTLIIKRPELHFKYATARDRSTNVGDIERMV